MAPRLSVAVAVGVVACAALAGCRDSERAPAPASPAQYISAVEALLDPPARLASTIAERTGADPPAAPPKGRLADLVDRARVRLAELRALRLEDPALRRQRDRLAAAYARLIPRMQTAVDAVSSDDRAAIARGAGPFLESLRSLPSALAAPASR